MLKQLADWKCLPLPCTPVVIKLLKHYPKFQENMAWMLPSVLHWMFVFHYSLGNISLWCYICVYIYTDIPRAPMTSMIEVQALKTRPFLIKTSVVWVLGGMFVLFTKNLISFHAWTIWLWGMLQRPECGAVQSWFKICRNTVDECIVRSNEVFPSSLKEKNNSVLENYLISFRKKWRKHINSY